MVSGDTEPGAGAVGAQAELYRRVIGAGVAVSSEVALDRVLERIVAAACELTGARYGALGVLDPTRSELEQFVTVGLTDEERARLGVLPRGRGVLGALIRDARPLRLRDLCEDPRSVGFPPGHPPMHSFLGVPVIIRGAPYGNLYLTEKEGGEFTDADVEAVGLLAAQAATAVEHARMMHAARRWTSHLEALNEIGEALVGETDLDHLLVMIVDHLRRLVDARLVYIALAEAGDGLRVVATAGDAKNLLGASIPPSTKTARVLARGQSERVDSTIDDHEVDLFAVPNHRRIDMEAGLWIPLMVGGERLGIIVVGDKLAADRRFSEDDLRLAEAFGHRASIAIDHSRRVHHTTLAAILDAQETERARLSRELHDQTGQALTSILLGLTLIGTATTFEEVKVQSEGMKQVAKEALGHVRRVAVELRPPALDDFGLAAALNHMADTVAESSGIDVQLAVTLPDATRLSSPIETATYRIAQEALTNAVKYAQAAHISITIIHHDGFVTLLVEDDGCGFSPPDVPAQHLGLRGMHERVAILGGDLDIYSTPTTGTTIRARIPTHADT